MFFSASTRDSISFFNVSSSKFFTELRAWVSSLSSFTRAASCSARFWMICWTSSSYSAFLSRAALSWVWLSNCTSRSPVLTALPAPASLMTTIDPRWAPASRGVVTT